MKKIFVTIALLISAIAVNANEVKTYDHINTIVTKDYKFVTNHEQLGSYLGLSDSIQINNVNHVYDVFVDAMGRAGKTENEKKRVKLVVNSIDYVVTGMRRYLDKGQFHKFLCIFNVDLQRRGFNEEAFIYCSKK